MIKLVVSDMDGTLLNRKGGISRGNVEAIKELEKNNIEFAIASGRDFKSVYSIMNQYDIACEARKWCSICRSRRKYYNELLYG